MHIVKFKIPERFFNIYNSDFLVDVPKTMAPLNLNINTLH